MNKTIGLLAHVDAGKTTFAEQLLYHTKSIKQRGRVDHRDAFLDSHEIEKQRGITVFADQATLNYKDSQYFLIDTPGHVDFSPEMERAIQVMDYAIIIISGVEGLEGHTETVWQLLRKHKVPTFFFINKMDRVGADKDRVIEDIKSNLTENVCDLSDSFFKGKMEAGLIEFLAERNERLLDEFLENGYDDSLWLDHFRKMIRNGEIFPCASGSALQDTGVLEFLENIEQLTYTEYKENQVFSGRVYKIRHEDNGSRVTFMKVLSGSLKVREEISYGREPNEIVEKITQIRVYSGNKFKPVDQAQAGEIVAVTGLSGAHVGEGLGALKEKATYELVPTLKSRINFEPSTNMKEAIHNFKLLGSEDPSLNVTWEEGLQQLHISVMGTIQLEVLEQLVKERFGYKVSFEDPEIIYKETVEDQVIGFGHFEPLGHYAEVHLKIEPAERNSGVTFENKCHADDLLVGHQNLVQQHLFEREHHGLLTGSALTDVKITLLTGRAHNKHTSGGDFREATFRSLRQGLEKAKNIVLEPYYQYRIKVEIDQMGRVLSDVQTAHGSFDTPVTDGNKAIITGKVPVATFMNYSTELASFTHGKGVINLLFAGYDRCHNEQAVIDRINYKKDADSEYTSSSIFCSKGQGYSVSWDEAEKLMHGL
ncbi:GTP-binding protein [Cytobacillus sp. FJAT-54145]|uniref:GTP-binding protein n=1 Tax=Cytobacillus spartinae TaxID=3299023 RepID=A0ABW6KIY2_9BACI